MPKAKTQQLERKWRKTCSSVDYTNYRDQCRAVCDLMSRTKSQYYLNKIADCQGDQKKLFYVLNDLTKAKDTPKLPSSASEQSLVDDFMNFFGNKITKTHTALKSRPLTQDQGERLSAASFTGTFMSSFAPMSVKTVLDTIKSMKSKQCSHDPIPTYMIKEHALIMASVLCEIINLSLHSATFPDDFKHGILKPKLKHHSLDQEMMNNYRPLTNLQFLLKLIEKCVHSQFDAHLASNNLHETFQSAYKANHSIETAMLRIYNDVVMSLGAKKSVLLLTSDISAAFDTIDHDVLLSRLKHRLGVTGKAHDWFRSYLTARKQSVQLESTVSHTQMLNYGVPQGSVLGPALFNVYMMSLSDILKQHNVGFHTYADDTQVDITCDLAADTLDEQLEKLMIDIDRSM